MKENKASQMPPPTAEELAKARRLADWVVGAYPSVRRIFAPRGMTIGPAPYLFHLVLVDAWRFEMIMKNLRELVADLAQIPDADSAHRRAVLAKHAADQVRSTWTMLDDAMRATCRLDVDLSLLADELRPLVGLSIETRNKGRAVLWQPGRKARRPKRAA